MDLAQGYNRAKKLNRMKRINGGNLGLNSNTLLVVRLPESQVLRVLSRSVFLVAVVFALPCIESILRGPSSVYLDEAGFVSRSVPSDFKVLDLLLRDFVEAGLVKKGDKALIVSPGIENGAHRSRFLDEQEIDLEFMSNLESQRVISVSGNVFDFVFLFGSVDVEFLDRILKDDGIVAGQLGDKHSNIFGGRSNYRIVYLKRFGSSILAIRKSDLANDILNSSRKLRFCKVAPEVKKAALKGLEDVLLEPPRRAFAMSKEYLKKIKYLPDLLGDSLQEYSRRVFVNVGSVDENNEVLEWFHQNYPTRNQYFETYNLELAPEGALMTGRLQIDVSNWLMENVKESDYVVMKAEAELVEAMTERKTICLVDELFLECNNLSHEGEKTKGKRAYWECLALYGRLKDEGVAVHQWWG